MNDELRRGTRLLWLFTALPPLFLVALFGIGRVPARWHNLYLLGAIGGLLTTVVTITVREHHREERNHGLVPKKRGFSHKLVALAEKLRAHADDLDGEPLPRATRGVAKELRRLAREQDQRELPSLNAVEDDVPDAAKLRLAAKDLEGYAREVRARGGIFQLGLYEKVMGVLVLVGGFAWGCRLVWRYWDGSMAKFFLGAFLVVSCGGLLYAFIRSQREEG